MISPKAFQLHLSITAAVLCLVVLLAGFAMPSALATTYFWDNNGSTAGFGTASGTWASPTIGDATQGWSTSSTGTVNPGIVTTANGDILNFGTGALALRAGTIMVSGLVTNTTLNIATNSMVTLASGTIVLAGASPVINGSAPNTVISSDILLLANATINAPNVATGTSAAVPLTLDGQISGAANLTFNGVQANNAYGTIILNAPSSYTGSTKIDTSGSANTEIFFKLGTDNALPTTTVLTLDGQNGTGSGRYCELNLNGHNQTLAGLTSVTRTLRTQRVVNSISAPASTLTVNNSSAFTYPGRLGGSGASLGSGISGDNFGLTKGGSGTLTLSGNNTYAGDTTISAGILTLGGAGQLGGGSYAGNITNNAAFNYNSTAAQNLSGVISGSGSLTNFGSGTLILTGTDALPRTAVSGGILAVSGGSVTGAVIVNSGGTLNLTNGGSVNLTTVNTGGNVSLSGAGVATNLVFASAGTMSFDVAAGGVLTVSAANGITNNGAAGSITINITGTGLSDGTYTLFNYSGSLGGSGFSAYQLGSTPGGKLYTLANTTGAVQLSVASLQQVDIVSVETKADGTGVAVPATTVLAGTALTNFAIARAGDGTFLLNSPASWLLTNLTGSVLSSHLVAAPDGKSAVFKPTGAGSARILAVADASNLVASGVITVTNSAVTNSLYSRPFIWVRDSERAGILAKIATNAWATSLFNGMVSRVAADVASHQSDRDAWLRGLPVDWTISPAKFKTVPAYAESVVRYPTEAKFNDALDCAVLYYLTGDAKYARCAADVLHNAVQTLLPVAPSTDVGNGGWIIQNDFLKEARVTGTQLGIIYDFLYSYLQTNQVYDVQTAGLVNLNFTNAQSVFRTLYQLARDHGSKDNNWSALMSTCMLNSLLALDSSTERAAALQIYLTTGSSRQASLQYDYRVYTQPGDIWPESLQYSGAVGSIRSSHMVLLERVDPSLNLFDAYPNLPLSLPRISYLRYPNDSLQISFGDGSRDAGGQPFFRYELVYQHALARGRTNLTSFFGSLINGGVAAGSYNRSSLSAYSSLGQHDEPLELLWRAPTISEASVTPELPRTDTLPYAGIALQRNPSTVNNSTYGLMGFVGGAAHVHSHACGMAMEIFGLGQVMGAKAGHDAYGSTIHEHYYRLFAAGNTIVVNAASQGSGGWSSLGINTVQVVAMEPQPFATAVSSNFSFTCSAFADNMGAVAEATQQRTLSIIRTSPTNGFYVDFYRSKSTVTSRVATTLNGNVTNQFHDYIYHNIGSTSVSLTTNDVALPLVSQANRFQNDIGDTYQQPGWRYFTNTVVSYPHNQPTRAQFNATPSGTTLYMDMILPAITNREYAKVTTPPITDYSTANSPALVVRQIGDAWDKPFAVVYEPHYGATGGTVTNVTTLLRSNILVGLKIESVAGGKSLVYYVFSNPNSSETYADASIGLSFTGRFGIVVDHGSNSVALYLGQGKALAYRGNVVAVAGGTNSQAEVQFTPGQSPVITANAPVQVTAAGAPSFTQITRQADGVVSIAATGAQGVPYRLWGSTNLASGTWALLNSAAVVDTPFVIRDASATNLPVRYYRFSTP